MMRKDIQKAADMEHITAQEFCDNMDTVLDRVLSEDIGLVIDFKDKEYVICPYNWFSEPQKEHFETAMKGALRYALEHDDPSDICSIITGSNDFLSAETLSEMNAAINQHIKEYAGTPSTATWSDLLRTFDMWLANSAGIGDE